MRDQLPANVSSRLVSQRTCHRATDHVSKLKKIVGMRVLDSHLADVTFIVARTVHLPPQMRGNVPLKLLRARTVNDHRGIAQVGPCRLKDQVAGVAVKFNRRGTAMLFQFLLVQNDAEVLKIQDAKSTQKVLPPFLLELAEVELKMRLQIHFPAQLGDAIIRSLGLLAVLKQHQSDDQIFGRTAALTEAAVAGFINEYEHGCTHAITPWKMRQNRQTQHACQSPECAPEDPGSKQEGRCGESSPLEGVAAYGSSREGKAFPTAPSYFFSSKTIP